MKIKTIEFVGSAVSKSQYPDDGLGQIVFSGRSNVGKSSFINSLLLSKNIARVSQTPGKTRLINFFLINKLFYFVDIPGYGYANVSKAEILRFASMIDEYLKNPLIKMAILLLDIRRVPNEDDLLMYEYFKSLNIKLLIVLTKADKLSNNQRVKQVNMIKNKLFKEDVIIPYSTKSRINHDEIWTYLEKAVGLENED